MLRSNQQGEEGDGTGLSRKRCLLGNSFSGCELVAWFPGSSSGSLILWGSVIPTCLFSLFPPVNSFPRLLSTPGHQMTACGSRMCVVSPEPSSRGVEPLQKFNEINRSLHQASLQSDGRSQLDHLAERWRPGDTVGRRGVAVEASHGSPLKLLFFRDKPFDGSHSD